MSRLFLFFSFLFSMRDVHGQTNPKRVRFPSQQESEISEKNSNCAYRQRYSAAQRLTMFPFNSASAVQLVSFDHPPPDFTVRLPLENGRVDYTRLKEIQTLAKPGIDSLTDILYNYGYRGRFALADRAQCYIPRHAILFVDASGHAFAYIELCFECGRSKSSSKAVEAGDFCTQKYELLKSFFLQHGITLGTKENGATQTRNR